MSRILHKIEEKLHIHHKHEDDPPAAQNKPKEIQEIINDESNADKTEDSHDDKNKNLVRKVAGKIAKKLLHGHHKNSGEEGYEGEEKKEGEEAEVKDCYMLDPGFMCM
ncbi:hypothetical protein FXO37_27767 [Capsicum annuum]|nr:hypothetical protein FXO37_27767 [Capsicum annuum]